MNRFKQVWRSLNQTLNGFIVLHGTRTSMIFTLASIALLDAFVPVSANIFVVLLAILQPAKTRLIVATFAISAGLSSFVFATVLQQFVDAGQWFGLDTFGEQWQQASATINQYGPSLLALLAIFPDIPRMSILVISLGDVSPAWIGLMVCAGKLVLYSGFALIINKVPPHWASRRPPTRSWQRWLWQRARRFQAYRRRLNYVVPQHGSAKSTQCFSRQKLNEI